MKIRPLHDRIIVKRLEEERTSAGGIIIPDTATEKPIQGWYSGYYTEKTPNPTAIFSAEIPGTTTFAWVLVPARGAVPPVQARVLSSREDRIELRVQVGSEKAFVVVVPMNSWRPSVRREG